MKPYGYKRRDNLTCKYGCCESRNYGRHGNGRPAADRSRRKRARQEGKKLSQVEV